MKKGIKFGQYDLMFGRCTYCNVAVECYESSDTPCHPGTTSSNQELP